MAETRQLVDAMREVLADEQQPLELWRVAKAAQVSEGDVISALFSAMQSGTVVTFRYPPLPCAAVVAIMDRHSVSETTEGK